jgi:predicted RecB family nuclease
MFDARFAMKCDEWIHKTYASNLFDLSARRGLSLTQQMRAKNGIDHEKKVVAKLEEVFAGQFLRISALSIEAQETQTLAALQNPDLKIILGARLGSFSEQQLDLKPSEKVSMPDLLIRYGNGWVPVDIKSSKANDGTKKSLVWEFPITDLADAEDVPIPRFVEGKLRTEHAMQVAHYFTHLQVHGFSNKYFYGGIIGVDGEKVLMQDLSFPAYSKKSALEIYAVDYAYAVDVAINATARNLEPTLPAPAHPIWKSICGECEFNEVCKVELKSGLGGGHISLLAGVSARDLDKDFAGIETIEQAATYIHNEDSNLQELATRSLSWLDCQPRLLPNIEEVGIPEFDIEIDIDLENSLASLFGDSLGEESVDMDIVFQYGWIRHERFRNSDWREAETGVFENFNQTAEADLEVQLGMWNWLQRQVADAESHQRTIGIFHYSPHERGWWRKFANRYVGESGVPTLEEVEDFISKYFVDLHPYMKRLALPVMGYSIKDLAPLANFNWMVEDAGGDTATLKFIAAVDPSSPDQLDAQQWLTNYNRGDVQATMAVRNWARSLAI